MPNIPPMMDPKREARGNYEFFEVTLAPGPQAIGATGDNSFNQLFGREWLMYLERETNRLRIFQEDASEDGAWTEIEALLPPLFDDPLPEGARRVTFAFDQSARVIVAYEVNGHVFITRWDTNENAYKQNVDFAGHDPVAVMDASWALDIPNSDVLVFYLSDDRQTLRARVQRDNYGTAYDLHAYGGPVVLDLIQALPLRYQALSSDSAGDPLEDSGQRISMVSDLYPYLARSGVSALAQGVNGGAYELVVVRPNTPPEGLAASAEGVSSGLYVQPIVSPDVAPEALASSGVGIQSGLYELVVIRPDVSPEELAAAGIGVSGGLYERVIVRYGPVSENLATSAVGVTGGSYVAA